MAGDPGGEITATGLSQREVAEISFARWVGDLKCVVDALSLERFVLLGAWQGASISIQYAVRNLGLDVSRVQ